MSDETMTKYDSVLKELFDNSKEYITSNEALAGHVRAFRTFDSSLILSKLSMPMTIFSGQDDRLIPIVKLDQSCPCIATSEADRGTRLPALSACGSARIIDF